MFERFSESSRQVIVFAQEEARELQHNYIGTEHLLLGLLREDTSAGGRTLLILGVTLEAARFRILQVVGQGDEVSTGQVPFSPRGKKALELALREALAMGMPTVGTEHVLLGLMRENESVAARILNDFGVGAQDVRDAVMAQISRDEPVYQVTETAEAVASGPGVVTYGPAEWPFGPTRPALILAIVLAAVGFPLGLLVGFFIWG